MALATRPPVKLPRLTPLTGWSDSNGDPTQRAMDFWNQLCANAELTSQQIAVLQQNAATDNLILNYAATLGLTVSQAFSSVLFLESYREQSDTPGDWSLPFARAVADATTLCAQGNYACINPIRYEYKIGTDILDSPEFGGVFPRLNAPVSVVGGGSGSTYFILSPNLDLDDFMLCQSSVAAQTPDLPQGTGYTCGSPLHFNQQIRGFSVVGDRRRTTPMSALRFTNYNRFNVVDDLNFYFINGTALETGYISPADAAAGMTKSGMVESFFGRMRFESCGDGTSSILLAGNGPNFGWNQVTIAFLESFGQYGHGPEFRAFNGANHHQTYIGKLRSEGLEEGIGVTVPTFGDQFRIGNSEPTDGSVYAFHAGLLTLTDEYAGQSAFVMDAPGLMQASNDVDLTIRFSGNASNNRGNGMMLLWGYASEIEVLAMSPGEGRLDTGTYTTAAPGQFFDVYVGPNLGNNVIVYGGGQENTWSCYFDPLNRAGLGTYVQAFTNDFIGTRIQFVGGALNYVNGITSVAPVSAGAVAGAQTWFSTQKAGLDRWRLMQLADPEIPPVVHNITAPVTASYTLVLDNATGVTVGMTAGAYQIGGPNLVTAVSGTTVTLANAVTVAMPETINFYTNAGSSEALAYCDDGGRVVAAPGSYAFLATRFGGLSVPNLICTGPAQDFGYQFVHLPPTAQNGQHVYCIDALKPGESSGAGTGMMVVWSNSAWYTYGGSIAAH